MSVFRKITVCLDMAGCPNRCKHCWLGNTPNGKMSLDNMITVANKFRTYTDKFEIMSWYREPDFRDDYKNLWELEEELSDEKAPHFELSSFWRLVRDEEYVNWLYTLGVRTSQLTLFGNEKTTDYYIGRKGAYQEIIKSIDILLKHGIAPRLQVFINKENIEELPFVENLIHELDLEKRCKEINQEFHLFVHQGSCDGENEKLYDIRVAEEDLNKIPFKLVNMTLNYMKVNSINGIFGESEKTLINELADSGVTKTIVSPSPVFYIDHNFNVYPNETELSPWWCLGNLNKNCVEEIINHYIHNKSIAQNLISTTSIGEMVKACGNTASDRLFTKGDYITYIINQYCKSKFA